MFPEAGKNDVISCHALTPDFLVLGTDMGAVSYFFLEDWARVQEFRCGILVCTPVIQEYCLASQ